MSRLLGWGAGDDGTPCYGTIGNDTNLTIWQTVKIRQSKVTKSGLDPTEASTYSTYHFLPERVELRKLTHDGRPLRSILPCLLAYQEAT